MNLENYIKEIEKTNDIDTLKAIWWTIGMDSNIDREFYVLANAIMERYNKIK